MGLSVFLTASVPLAMHRRIFTGTRFSFKKFFLNSYIFIVMRMGEK